MNGAFVVPGTPCVAGVVRNLVVWFVFGGSVPHVGRLYPPVAGVGSRPAWEGGLSPHPVWRLA